MTSTCPPHLRVSRLEGPLPRAAIATPPAGPRTDWSRPPLISQAGGVPGTPAAASAARARGAAACDAGRAAAGTAPAPARTMPAAAAARVRRGRPPAQQRPQSHQWSYFLDISFNYTLPGYDRAHDRG